MTVFTGNDWAGDRPTRKSVFSWVIMLGWVLAQCWFSNTVGDCSNDSTGVIGVANVTAGKRKLADRRSLEFCRTSTVSCRSRNSFVIQSCDQFASVSCLCVTLMHMRAANNCQVL